MFICANCGVANPAGVNQATKDKGDWIIVCLPCGAANILGIIELTSFSFIAMEILGYRDDQSQIESQNEEPFDPFSVLPN